MEEPRGALLDAASIPNMANVAILDTVDPTLSWDEGRWKEAEMWIGGGTGEERGGCGPESTPANAVERSGEKRMWMSGWRWRIQKGIELKLGRRTFGAWERGRELGGVGGGVGGRGGGVGGSGRGGSIWHEKVRESVEYWGSISDERGEMRGKRVWRGLLVKDEEKKKEGEGRGWGEEGEGRGRGEEKGGSRGKYGKGERQGEKESGSSVGGNALAGGAAGVIVSICTHPVDTVKTVMQLDRGASRALLPRVGSILAERGVWGLYSGIGAKLATSAPISAIYTSTYEAVKEMLLPRLPPSMAGVAHCLAGASASIATSAVFTPSEAVKQRMQITTEYSNSLAALMGMIRKEGALSLYGGLGAVLWRNIPNSIIKFLTYEWLKKRALRAQAKGSSVSTATSLSPMNQLLVGGVAGSTAAFFTTPFDVIKTRLQTQAQGVPQYSGVMEAFLRIVNEEGATALYRGVVPRLLIYVSQGAIFFASYELLRRALHQNRMLMPSHETAAFPSSSSSPPLSSTLLPPKMNNPNSPPPSTFVKISSPLNIAKAQ